MFAKIRKRVVSGLLAVATAVSSLSTALMPGMSVAHAATVVRNDVELIPGETYSVFRDGSEETFGPFVIGTNSRQWVAPMKLTYTKSSPAQNLVVYCGSPMKESPNGNMYNIVNRLDNKFLCGVLAKSDARMGSAAAFRNSYDEGTKALLTGLTDFEYFCASQIAVWAATDAGYFEDGTYGQYSWKGNSYFGLNKAGYYVHLGGPNLESSARTLFAAYKILEKAKEIEQGWNTMGHMPYLGGAFTYTTGQEVFDKTNKASGSINLKDAGQSVASSGKFKKITHSDGKNYYILPMSANSATSCLHNQIKILLEDAPEGVFLMNADKSVRTSHELTIETGPNFGAYDNGNNGCYGGDFYLFIPEEIADKELSISLTAVADVDRYEAYMGREPSGAYQDAIIVMPSTKPIDFQFTLTAGENNVTVDKTNLEITKVDADDENVKLKGAKFKIEYKDSDGTTKELELPTGDDGKVTFKRLPLGAEVKITETEASSGYALMNPNPVTITLPSTPDEKGYVSYTFKDTKLTSTSIKIIKTEKGNATKKLAGAKFTVAWTDHPASEPLVTNTKGEINITGIPFNTEVTVTEVEPPPGYKLANPATQKKTTGTDGTVVFEFPFENEPEDDTTSIKVIKLEKGNASQKLKDAEFKITWPGHEDVEPMKTNDDGEIIVGGIPFNTEVTVTETKAPPDHKLANPATQKKTTGADKNAATLEFIFENEADVGDTGIKIIKTEQDNASKLLAGAEFDVTWAGNTGDPVHLVTQANGVASCEHGLPVNTAVTVTETKAPSGYELSEPKTQTVTTAATKTAAVVEVTFANKPQTTGIKIIKSDAEDSSKKIAGAVFEVTWAGNATPKNIVTDANGVATCDGIPLNTAVTIKETAAPEEYELMNPNPMTATSNSTTAVLEIPITDKKKKGELKIRKVDADTGEPLAGASFDLQQIDGSFHTSAGPTNSDGIVTIKGEELPDGAYKVTEINAPEGYVLNPEPQTFDWDGESIITLTFKDYHKGALEIYKYDAETGAALVNATFELWKDGKCIDSMETGPDGRASKSGLEEGLYQVKEIAPPGGYLKDTKVYEVYIDPEDTAEIVREIDIPNKCH